MQDKGRSLKWIMISLILISLVFSLLHLIWSDLKVEGIRWFNLDKERNLPTWFSGALFFMLGITALMAYFSEKNLESKLTKQVFNSPFLWVILGLTAFYLSLDEITILHENLFWKEIRVFTAGLDENLMFITQWQILFAPLIILLLSFILILFANRFKIVRISAKYAFLGIVSAVTAIFLEAVRSLFKVQSSMLYNYSVVLEELCEMLFAIFILLSIINYIYFLSSEKNFEIILKFKKHYKLITTKVIKILLMLVILFVIMAITAYGISKGLVDKNIDPPKLHERALKK